MSNNAIIEWFQEMSTALDTSNGTQLAFLLSSKCPKLHDQCLHNITEAQIENACQNCFGKYNSNPNGSTLFHFLVEYLKLRVNIANNRINWDDIIKKSFKLLDLWLELYLNVLEDHYWLVPGLYSLCNFVNRIGTLADRYRDKSDNISDLDNDDDKDKYMKQVLSTVRSKMGSVRGDETRHSAYIVLLGQSIKGCMQLGNMQMAAGFLKAIESTTINYSKSLRGPLINYRYYLGKLHMQKEEYFEAEEHLSWAFSNCLKDSIKMRRYILECLIVVRLGLGKLPPFELLNKYNLLHYIEIVKSIKAGNIQRFTLALNKYMNIFIREGTVLCVEKLKYIAYRILIRNVKKWWDTNVPSGKNNMLPCGTLTCTVKCQDVNMTDNEMLCICSNMIKRGYIKGYVSWERLMIVFSTIQPFPPISSCIMK